MSEFVYVTYIRKAREMFEEDGTVPAIRNFAKAVGIKDRKANQYEYWKIKNIHQNSFFEKLYSERYMFNFLLA